jgi:flagellar L-ring protein precursor FlgH
MNLPSKNLTRLQRVAELRRRAFLQGAMFTGLSLGLAAYVESDDGPNSSLYSTQLASVSRVSQINQSPAATSNFQLDAQSAPPPSWYEIPIPPPKQVRVNDIITIRVDTGARLSESAQLQRRRTGQYDARLNDWVILEGLRAIKPAPQSDGDQRIQANLTQLNRVTGQLDTAESLKFEIAATVSAVLPNGNIVLEAHRVIQNNNEQWMHSLSGICRREDVGPNNIVLSKDIANLRVKKEELGQIRDAYKRGWLLKWWDQFAPF